MRDYMEQQSIQRKRRPLTEEERRRREIRRKKRRRKVYLARTIAALIAFFLIFTISFGIKQLASFLKNRWETEETADISQEIEEPVNTVSRKKVARPEFQVDLLTINEYSRPGYLLPEVKNIFVHYTANKGTSAAQNRSYFENLKDTHETSASAHFIIGFEGEAIQCIPLMEIDYAVMQRNYDSVSIECCFLDESGKFTDATYNKLVEMLAWLVTNYDLTPEDILRHYDVGGKLCPKYYVEHEDEWNRLIEDVAAYIEKFGVLEESVVE
ncbi:MAG: N-acetylmuramoyl-L-alanine amidase [Lachnospiraceae bacterium]|nr:N-acetylmuramoyl-L-alanine amidase [Lachnospiraceae bacterium]